MSKKIFFLKEIHWQFNNKINDFRDDMNVK